MQGVTQDFRDILRGLRMAVDFNRLIFAFAGIVCSIIWILMILGLGSAFKLTSTAPLDLINNVLVSPSLGLSYVYNAFLSSMAAIDWAEYVGLVVLVLGLLVIWSIFGGSITRSAALEFAREEKIGFKDPLSFASKKFWSYFWSPITPALGILFFTACNILGGLIGQVKYIGEIAVAIGFPLAIISGFLIIFIGIVGILGFFLMFPTISAEGSDAFDAMSRAYSYVISKPRHFISLFLSMIICGTIFVLFISLVACLVMQTSFYTVGFGMGQKFESIRAVISGSSGDTISSLDSLPMRFTALMLLIYIALVKLVLGSMVLAFAGSASTISYFLLRKDVDGTNINDVYVEEKESEKKEEEKEEARAEEEKDESADNEEGQTVQDESEKTNSSEEGTDKLSSGGSA